jgi:hypothetical protein
MKENKKAILKAGVCLAVAMAMLLPSVVATNNNNRLPLLRAGVVSVIAGTMDSAIMSDDDLQPVESITVHGLSMGVTSTIQFQQNTETYSFIAGGDPPDIDSGLCGVIESKNSMLFANSFPWVHTYNEHIAPPIWISMIYENLFISENRPGRTKAYVVIPSMEYKNDIGDNSWGHSPWLVGIIIWENQNMPYTYIGRLGFGKGVLEDHIFPFRTHIIILDESARGYDENGQLWVKFVRGAEKDSDTGFWFNDQYPYTNNANDNN